MWEAAKAVYGWCYNVVASVTRRISHTDDLPDNCAGQWLFGKVTGISDGDGFKFFHCPLLRSTTYTSEDSKLPVRLAGIDAPEMGKSGMPGQPFAKEAKEYLRSLIQDKDINMKVVGKDQYDRVLAFAYVRGWFSDTNVNLEMVKKGLACVYIGRDAKYDEYEESLFSLEKEAKEKKEGMWKCKKTVTPMEHKRKYKQPYMVV